MKAIINGKLVYPDRVTEGGVILIDGGKIIASGDVRMAFKCASTNPAKALGLDGQIGSILPGRDANIIFVDDTFNVQKVIFRGQEIA